VGCNKGIRKIDKRRVVGDVDFDEVFIISLEIYEDIYIFNYN
jgi:hypothetical protein